MNHLYFNWNNRRILTKEARNLKKEIKELIVNQAFPLFSIDGKLKVKVDIYEDWYCENGSIKKKDLLNREKFLVDSVFEALGMDDKFIFEYQTKKIQSTKEKAIIEINILN